MNAKLMALVSVMIPLAASTTQAAELIANGGFEGGVYTSTLGGATNPNVPLDWTPNAAFDLEPGFNQIRAAPHSGLYNLSIGNYDAQPVAALSQSFADVAGASYSVSLYVLATGVGDAAANFTASVGGVSHISLSDTINSYTLETFSFIGTGHDTLTLAANTNPGEWYVDDVSVTGTPGSGVPEPETWLLMTIGFGGIGAFVRRRNLASIAG